MRKEADFEVMDRIRVGYTGSDKIVDIFDKKGDFIASEVLAKEIVTENGQGYTKDWKINGEDVTLTVEKIK